MPLATINPTTGETLREFVPLDESQLEVKLQCAAAAFATHRRTSIEARAAKLLRAADILDAERDFFARLMTTEMGKPIGSARDEVSKCARTCRYYAEQGAHHLADEYLETEAARSFVRYQPLGVVLAIMPWNFPFWQVFRFAAPALLAGNVGLLKHAANVPQCALAIEDVWRRAGFDADEFQTLLIESGQVARVLSDGRVAAATLTGSEPAGSQVASLAGKLIKKTVLELGGSDPFIVMPSANLSEAVKVAVKSRTINNGQSCIAAKRFIVVEDIYDEFAQRFVAAMNELAVGDPLDEANDLGPLATPQILAELEAQVSDALAAGARLVAGGQRLQRRGNFYPPTVLADIPSAARVYQEELFGPVALLFRARDLDDAIRLANDTEFGLGASAWTRNEAEAARFVEELEAGAVFINAMVASDPRLPFGGIKHSGYGRELGTQGIREFVNCKTVWINREAGAD